MFLGSPPRPEPVVNAVYFWSSRSPSSRSLTCAAAGEQPPLMVTIEMSSLSENHLLAAILANGHMITAVRGAREP